MVGGVKGEVKRVPGGTDAVLSGISIRWFRIDLDFSSLVVEPERYLMASNMEPFSVGG
jgi:hypothetical protein